MKNYFDFDGVGDRYDGNIGTVDWYNNPDPFFDDGDDGLSGGKKKGKKKKKKSRDYSDYEDDDDISYGGYDDYGF